MKKALIALSILTLVNGITACGSTRQTAQTTTAETNIAEATVSETVTESADSQTEELTTEVITTEAVTEQAALPENLSVDFVFSSGAGAWGTELHLDADGSFSGSYHDSDMGAIGEDYPNGTVYESQFSGTFTEIKQIDETTYSMRLESIETEQIAGEERIEDGVMYISAEPYGMETGEQFYLYAPGAKVADLPESYVGWVSSVSSLGDSDTLPFYGLYNEEPEYGFFSAVE